MRKTRNEARSAVGADTITLRPATSTDAALLLEWRNDPVTRANSFNTARVAEAEHRDWFTASLKNPQRRILIAVRDGAPVGMVRADLVGGATELSWGVAPRERGRGAGKAIVAVAVKLIGGSITARIKAGNAASARVALSAGFVLEREEGGVTYWRRTL